MVTRRRVLQVGTASALIIGGAGLFRALHSDLSIVRQPWSEAGETFEDVRLNALSYAILAPNPHNRQPWLIRLDGEDSLTVFCDRSRLLPETDPYNRQIVIGFGAFLELLRQAAVQNGYRLEQTLFPDGEPQPILDERPIATIRFIADAAITPDALFGQALRRRTVRANFDQDKPVTPDTLAKLAQGYSGAGVVFGTTALESRVKDLKALCQQGWDIEIGTPHTHHESTSLTRIGEAAITRNPDGITLSGPFMEAMRIGGVITEKTMNDPQSKAYQGMYDFYADLIDTAMAFAWIITPDNSRAAQIEAGIAWVRIQLMATQLGLGSHPLSQVLQEFPEMAGPYKAVHDALGVDHPARIQGVFRLGYADYPAPAPRWSLESRLMDVS